MKIKHIYKTSLLCYAGCFFLIIPLFAQHSIQKSFQWAGHIGGKGKTIPAAVACDTKDNIYIAGRFTDSLANINKQVKSAGRYDIFIARYNKAGKQKWLWSAGSEGVESITCVQTDTENNLWFTGEAAPGTKFGKIPADEKKKFLFLARIILF